MLIDSHCHLHDREFFTSEQAEEMLARARENGIYRIVCIGTSISDSLVAREFAESHDGVFWTFGVHPNEVVSEEDLRQIQKELAELNPEIFEDPKLVAIGEVGLDYHYEGFNRDAQIKLFEEMIGLAEKNNLPISFHVREAFPDFFEAIAKFPGVRGVIHSFTDSKKRLKRILAETDFYVGVNGIATYMPLALPPLERILLETDAPFLTPKPFRGIINESAYIRNIAEWLAEQKGANFETIEKETTKNAERLFNFSDSILR
ncbi:MAG: TatD family hydrolase [Candidatus Saccharibacteria bacterium]|nr:TatD family hydrolase [Candidatus Saccharibacteria bacterium]